MLGTISYSCFLSIFKLLMDKNAAKSDILQKLQNYSDDKHIHERQRCRQVINQAFLDMKYKGDLYVIFTRSNKASPNVTVLYYTERNKKVALVEVTYHDVNFLKHYKKLYAVAAHEASHVLHKSQSIQSAYQGASVGFIHAQLAKASVTTLIPFTGPWLSVVIALVASFPGALALSDLFFGQLCQKTEKDADITAATRLGVGLDLANYLQTIGTRPNLPFWQQFKSSHPSHAERIEYLTYIHERQFRP